MISQRVNEVVKTKRLRWYGRIKWRENSDLVVEAMNKEIQRLRKSGRLKETWLGQIHRY